MSKLLPGEQVLDRRNSGPGAVPEIERLTKRLDDEPTYYVELLGLDGALECSFDQLWSYRDFQKLTAKKWDHGFDDVTPKQWREKVRQALKTVEKMEANPDTDKLAAAREVAVDFLTNRQVGERREDLLVGKPWEDVDGGRFYFKLGDLMKHFTRGLDSKERLTRTQVSDAIVKWDGGREQNMVVDGHRPSLRWLPASFAVKPPPAKAAEARESPI
jgi:hypothetical protein